MATTPLTLSDHPNFGAAMQAYQAAKATAEATGDPNAIQRVELDWANKRLELTEDLSRRREAEVARQQAIANAKAQYGDIPDALLSSISDPAQIEALGKSWKEQLDARAPQPVGAGAVAPDASGDITRTQPAPAWGAPTPGGTPIPTVDEATRNRNRMEELTPLIQRGDPRAAEEYRRIIFNAHILPMQSSKTRGGQ